MTAFSQPPLVDQLPGADGGAVDRFARESQWRLMWWRFRQHKLAVVGLWITIATYLVVIFADVLAPADPNSISADHSYAPPQALQIVEIGPEGEWRIGPYVNGYESVLNPETLAREYAIDPDSRIELGFFVRGDEYRLLGLVPADIHLFGTVDVDERAYLLGADSYGRDLLSRLVHGTRVSMTIGLIGVAIAFLIGIVLGGVSGYFGGRIDTVIQRVVEFFMSLPTLPLWLGLAAALPPGWGAIERYFAITVILATVAWTDLARVVRGRFLSLRKEDFVISARLDGSSQARVIFRHMLPSFTSHLIASISLSIPGMILAETALSFLGLGLQPPVVSWGVLLQEAQSVRVLATAPWLLLPGAAVVVAVLALNFVGDGLRDAADPYKR